MVLSEETGRMRQLLECQTCQKTFTKLSNMKDHLKQHTGLRPYFCSLCGVGFIQKSNRNRHESINNCQDQIILLSDIDQQLGE